MQIFTAPAQQQELDPKKQDSICPERSKSYERRSMICPMCEIADNVFDF